MKNVKKATRKNDTVRALDDRQLAAVGGGAVVYDNDLWTTDTDRGRTRVVP